jgi:hypothetical protein
MSTVKLAPTNIIRDCSLAGISWYQFDRRHVPARLQSRRRLVGTSLTVEMYQQDYKLLED